MIEFRSRRRTASAQPSTLEAYDEIYQTSPIRQFDSFYLWALALADACPEQRLLDISCGVGRLVDLASEAGLVAVGVDLSSNAIVAGKDGGIRGSLCVGNAEALPFDDGSFDRVVNLGSLEHYENPERGVTEMARVLRPDGKAVVLLPNGFSYQHVIYVWRKGTVFDDGQPLQRYGTQADWRQLLENNGLSVVRTLKYQRVPPRTRADILWYLRRPTKLLQMLCTPFIPLNLANCFVFICTKRRLDLR